MHYRNGREARPGDRVIDLDTGKAGILYDVRPETATCNGRLAHPDYGDPHVTLANCVHADDVKAAFPKPDA